MSPYKYDIKNHILTTIGNPQILEYAPPQHCVLQGAYPALPFLTVLGLEVEGLVVDCDGESRVILVINSHQSSLQPHTASPHLQMDSFHKEWDANCTLTPLLIFSLEV